VELVKEVLLRAHLGHPEVACRDIDEGDAPPAPGRIPAHGHEVVRLLADEMIIFQDEPRGDDLHHLPAHEAFCGVRRLALLADRHLQALLDEPGYVRAGAVVRDPAHGDRVLPALVPGGQGDSQNP